MENIKKLELLNLNIKNNLDEFIEDNRINSKKKFYNLYAIEFNLNLSEFIEDDFNYKDGTYYIYNVDIYELNIDDKQPLFYINIDDKGNRLNFYIYVNNKNNYYKFLNLYVNTNKDILDQDLYVETNLINICRNNNSWIYNKLFFIINYINQINLDGKN